MLWECKYRLLTTTCQAALLSLLCTACFLFPGPELDTVDELGAIIRMDPLWIHPLTDHEIGLGHGVLKPVTKGEYALIIRNFNDEDIFTWVHAFTGESKWERDGLNRNFTLFDGDFVIKEDRLTVSRVALFQMDTENGDLNFYISPPEGQAYGSIAKAGEDYYVTRTNIYDDSTGFRRHGIDKIERASLEISPFLIPKYPADSLTNGDDNIGTIMRIASYNEQGKDYLVMVYHDFLEESIQNPYFAVYDLSEDQWLHEGVKIIDRMEWDVTGLYLQIYDGKAYFATNNRGEYPLYCFDILSGQKVWQYDFDQTFSTSGFRVAEGMVVVNNGEHNYGLNPDTGALVWKILSGGSPGPISIHKGVAYFAGGSDGRLNAQDIHTGEYLYRLYPPGDDYYKRHVAVVPGEGDQEDVIVTSTYREYLAYPAAKRKEP